MNIKSLLCALCAAIFSLGFVSVAEAAVLPLEGRLETSPGSSVYQAYYDPNLDITWAANANINGFDTWDNQVTWAAGLTIGGIGGWRLPSSDVNGDNILVDCHGGGKEGCIDNEMGFLYWEEGITVVAPGPFTNVQVTFYWSGTAWPNTVFAWDFRFLDGIHFAHLKSDASAAWAVHDGDIGAVPIPSAAWLFGSGLLGLVGVARRKAQV